MKLSEALSEEPMIKKAIEIKVERLPSCYLCHQLYKCKECKKNICVNHARYKFNTKGSSDEDIKCEECYEK